MSDQSHSHYELNKQAAIFGPGFKGERIAPVESDRQALLDAFETAGAGAPEYLLRANSWVDRHAKLFEAGEYPDKNLSVTAEDLQRIAESFDMPVPVLIEHASSPLELGYLTKVEARGDELFGVLSLTEPADALINHSRARALSVGLSEELNSIREVSIVKNPRVRSAQLFHLEGLIDSETQESTAASVMDENSNLDPSKKEDLKNSKVNLNLGTKIDNWVRNGQLLPSQAKIVRKLVQPIGQFAQGQELSLMISEIFDLQPGHGLFKNQTEELVRESNSALLLPEEAAFFKRHFPEVSLDEIARRHTGGHRS